MILEGNVLIHGNQSYGLKLLEGIREFDLIILSASALTINALPLMKAVASFLIPGGKLLIKNNDNGFMLEHTLGLFGFGMTGRIQFEGNEWIIGERKGFGRNGSTASAASPAEYIKAASSIMNIDVDVEETAKMVLRYNFEDNQKRKFVLMQERNDEQVFESVRKQAIIYQNPLERIVLDDLSGAA